MRLNKKRRLILKRARADYNLKRGFSRSHKHFKTPMERVERANRSNLIRSNKGEYWYLRKDRAFWFNGEYYKQINILNLKDALFNE